MKRGVILLLAVVCARGLAAEEPEELEAALRHNLYGTVEPEAGQVRAVAAYLRREVAGLAAQPAQSQ